MIRKILFITSLLVIMLTSTLAIRANDFDNDPNTNPDANACFPGGTMEDFGCDSLYYWIAGFIKIRLEHGIFTEKQVPPEYEWLIDEKEIVEESSSKNKSKKSSGAGCVLERSSIYWDFGNSNRFAPGSNVNLYDDAACTLFRTTVNLPSVWFVAASSSAEADSICDSIDPGTVANIVGGGVYYCNIPSV